MGSDTELATLRTVPPLSQEEKPGKGGPGLSQPIVKIQLIRQEAKNPG